MLYLSYGFRIQMHQTRNIQHFSCLKKSQICPKRIFKLEPSTVINVNNCVLEKHIQTTISGESRLIFLELNTAHLPLPSTFIHTEQLWLLLLWRFPHPSFPLLFSVGISWLPPASLLLRKKNIPLSETVSHYLSPCSPLFFVPTTNSTKLSLFFKRHRPANLYLSHFLLQALAKALAPVFQAALQFLIILSNTFFYSSNPPLGFAFHQTKRELSDLSFKS